MDKTTIKRIMAQLREKGAVEHPQAVLSLLEEGTGEAPLYGVRFKEQQVRIWVRNLASELGWEFPQPLEQGKFPERSEAVSYHTGYSIPQFKALLEAAKVFE